MRFARIEDAVAAVGRGEIVVVVDDEDRENEGDLIMAAEAATPEKIAFFLHHTSGVICVPITESGTPRARSRADGRDNTESQRTAFTSRRLPHGTTTGISATTGPPPSQALIDPAPARRPLRPGHIFPLRYREGGVLEAPATPRPPSTSPAWPASTRPGVLCEIVDETRRTWRASPTSSGSPPSTTC